MKKATRKHKSPGKYRSRFFRASDEVWKAFLNYGPLDDGSPEGDRFDKALTGLLEAHHKEKFIDAGKCNAIEALANIVNALNQFPEPVHYKIREAIEAGRKAIGELDMLVEA